MQSGKVDPLAKNSNTIREERREKRIKLFQITKKTTMITAKNDITTISLVKLIL